MLGPVTQAFHQRCGVQKGALTSSFPLSSVSDPSSSANDAEGKVAAVSSANDLTAVMGRLWGLFHDKLVLVLGPEMGVGVVLTVTLEIVAVVGGGWRGRLMSPV